MERLLLHLEIVTKYYSTAQHFIVAHSHGGNIAFYALNDSELSNRLDGVICLSTPFLNVRDRSLGAIKRSGLLAAVIVGPMYICAWLLDRRFPNHEDLNLAIAIAAAIIVGFSLARKAASVSGRLSQSLRLAALSSDRVLIVRATGDEASAALSALQLASWLATQVWIWPATFITSVTSRVRQWSALAGTHWKGAVVMVLTGATLAGSASVFANEPLAHSANVVGAAVAVCGSLVLLVWWAGSGAGLYGYVLYFLASGLSLFPLIGILAILVVPFGWELAIACTQLDVTVEGTPPGTWVVHQLSALNTAGKDFGMSHAATHERADAIAMVTNWVKSRLAKRHGVPHSLR